MLSGCLYPLSLYSGGVQGGGPSSYLEGVAPATPCPQVGVLRYPSPRYNVNVYSFIVSAWRVLVGFSSTICLAICCIFAIEAVEHYWRLATTAPTRPRHGHSSLSWADDCEFYGIAITVFALPAIIEVLCWFIDRRRPAPPSESCM